MPPHEPTPPDAGRREPAPADAGGGPGAVWLARFTGAERSIHHVTALLMLVCLVTAAFLYFPFLSTMVGRRELLKTVHVWSGFALPVPIVLGLLSRAFRADLRRLNRFAPHDWEWLRRGDRRAVQRGRGVLPVGKFNAGQKLNAAFTAGAILVMLGTGEVLTFPGPWPDRWRTGATFVHDWLFLLILAVTAGHLWEALRDRGALTGMLTGRVERGWAERHHAGWADVAPEARAKARAHVRQGGDGTRPHADGAEKNAQVSGINENSTGASPGEGPEFAKRRPGIS
ncbi:cytochrome b/b6 domain-containing protein [Actinomadura sp. NEAU-AAG7]|uniref:cytochrome b/b6 domain-containing protein n=1 Tax=Actinomadura sp. NEAU-AAG7 TaxID=2839640 RepID=UPI002547C127|nr:cytochrome b/b6 domain-containing protein [Actinomadura sp. NEAU-AAG7]